MQLPESAPLSNEQRQALNAILTTLEPAQGVWLSGYLAGVMGGGGEAVVVGGGGEALSVGVLFGTESGNSEVLADETAAFLKGRGFAPKVLDMVDTAVEKLGEFEYLLVIVSTWGDGDPPDGVGVFYDALMGEDAPRLEKLRFSVCALGDTSYDKFCQCGKDVDRRLGELGGERLVDRVDCDVDYEDMHQEWLGRVVGELEKLRGPGGGVAAGVLMAGLGVAAVGVQYGKKNPYPAPLKERVLLNGKGSAKETWHLELGLEGSGMHYDPGDALGLVPLNAPDVVESILKAGGFDANRKVVVKDAGEVAFSEALSKYLDITGLTSVVLGKYNALAGSKRLEELLDPANKKELSDYLWGRQVIDIIEEYPIKGLEAQDFVNVLRKLPPRLYSIASSEAAHPGEVHLTIAAVRYNAHGRDRKGVASTFIADDIAPGDSKIPVYVHHNKNFKLPRSGDTPIIMVGPGTGVAPFRSFIEERAVSGAKGRSWLFYGDQRYTYDFMYQLEWQAHMKKGVLTRLDVAFSRDQKRKVYVQHRMLERSADMWAWLEEGAHFYVCGDASRMANDVHEALLQIIEKEGRLKRDAAEAYIEDLKKAKRYQRDVY